MLPWGRLCVVHGPSAGTGAEPKSELFVNRKRWAAESPTLSVLLSGERWLPNQRTLTSAIRAPVPTDQGAEGVVLISVRIQNTRLHLLLRFFIDKDKSDDFKQTKRIRNPPDGNLCSHGAQCVILYAPSPGPNR
jgi:hypothetical protein